MYRSVEKNARQQYGNQCRQPRQNNQEKGTGILAILISDFMRFNAVITINASLWA